MSKTYATWQVMRLLERHPDWTAEAPESVAWVAMTMRFSGDAHTVTFPSDSVRVSDKADSFASRSDWTIKKPKRKRVVRKLATIGFRTELRFYCGAAGGFEPVQKAKLDPSKTYRLLLVEVES